jgi:hypothetical protein|tara:strand:- start:3976 stop:4731 length:756 start_codon:yes stop_codon:yes gene_type:complete
MAAPSSRDTIIEYCLRRLGDPVIEINVDPDQLEDRLDEALEVYQEFHSDATFKTYLKHLVTATDVSNEYIPISSEVIFVQKLLPISSHFNNSMNFFDIKYQLALNDIADLQNFAGDLAYYEQMQQYLSLLDMKLNGTPQVNFARRQGRLYIHGDFQDNDIKEGDYIIAEVRQIVNPTTYTTIFDDMWLKSYTTALIKRQWGSNLIKFEGMQLPGGVVLNGRQIYEDALQDIERLEEKLRLEQELPVDFFVG